MFNLLWTPSFTKSARKFIKRNPQLKKQFTKIIFDLESDPFQPHLRLHPLKGDLKGLHAISMTHSYRIVLILEIAEKQITLLDIGSHDEVYR